MQRWIEKAGVLVEALPYIQRFRGEVIVIKYGGSAMEDPSHTESTLTDVVFMECVGMLPVIVHGGGKAISRALKKAGGEARFVKGLRVTDADTMALVERVMNGEVNPGVVAGLRAKGGRAEGLRGQELFTAEKHVERDAKTGGTLDWGFVGDVVDVRTEKILELTARGIIPVITPIGRDRDGRFFNLNADAAAAAVACALRARKLAYLSDVPGLLRNPADEATLIPTLREKEIRTLVKKGIIDGGMLPKVRSAMDAIQAGVRKVHFIDGRMRHSLLLEILTDKGVGTEIIRDED